ncbi:MAG: PAS domain-containing protein [Alphaproteobacteria bacterium]|nr:PAS domain-containing protein [Alphaproteobacteria bacterium]
MNSEAPEAQALIEALPDAVIGFDAALRVTFSNDAARQLFRLGQKQLQGAALPELLGEKQAVCAAVEAAVRKNQDTTMYDVTVNDRPAGSVSVVARVAGTGFMLVIRPQMAQLSGAWNEKTKYSLQSTQMLARMLAHEVKNPLAGIRGAAQLLEKSGLEKEDRELVGLIGRETRRIQELVEKFNIFDDVPREHYKPVNLHEVLNHVMQAAGAAYGGNIAIVTDFDPSLPEVRGHFAHLVQAAQNLVRNAAEGFGGGKGRIILRTYYDNAAAFHPERPEKLPLCVEIEDDGTGIASEDAGRIFQPYFTTKTGGQGLGLSIVSKIVDDHGGTIGVASRPGRTVFKISLPLGGKQ